MRKFQEMSDKVAKMEAGVRSDYETIRRLLTFRLRDWDTVENVYFNMKRITCIATLWLRFREKWVNYTQAIGTASDYARDDIRPYQSFENLRCGTYGTGWNQGTYDSRTVDASALVAGFPPLEQLAAVHKWTRAADALAADVNTTFQQTLQLYREIPEYKTIKKLLPIGGRLFYSVFKAVERGTLSRTRSTQNNLFGYENDLLQFGRLLTHCQRSLRPEREKSGPAPSWARAINESPPRYSSDLPRNDDTVTRLGRFNRSLPDSVRGTCNYNYVDSPTLLKLAKTDGYLRAMPLICKIMGVPAKDQIRNDVVTVFTSRPERLTGSDYVARGSWLETDRRDWRHTKRKIVSGFVYFRSNWPDCYHSKEQLSPAEASEKLDQASGYYFRQIERERSARLSERQRIAKIMKQLRKLHAVCVDDSYGSGNCVPGTQQFLSQLGISSDVRCVSGQSLSKLWRDAKYPQRSRFAAAVEHAENRTRKTVNEFFNWAGR